MLDQSVFTETIHEVAEIIRTSATPLSKEEILSYFKEMELNEQQENMVLEFLLTPHEEEEAEEETIKMLRVYEEFMKNVLAIPVFVGKKSEKEKFAGAVATYSMEAMMQDGKSLQAGTSHFLGQNFSNAFDINFLDSDGVHKKPYGTSWGTSTRMIGALIMAHGDARGLCLPPYVAPIQAVIVPIAAHKGGVLEKAREIEAKLKAAGFRVKLDDSEASPGWKFNEYEMKGVPVRIEIGPRDIENGVCMAVRRDNGEKTSVALSELTSKVPELLDAVQKSLYEKAKANMEEHTYPAYSLEEAKKIQEEKGGFIKTMWCGELACEMKMKDQAGMSSRCMPLHQEHLADTCPICGKPAKHMIYWGVAY